MTSSQKSPVMIAIGSLFCLFAVMGALVILLADLPKPAVTGQYWIGPFICLVVGLATLLVGLGFEFGE